MWKILHHIAAKFWRWLLTACSFNRELLIEADLLGPGGCFQVSSSGLQPESFHCVRFVTQLIHHTCRRLHGTPCYSFDTASTIPSESNSRAKCKYRLSSGANVLSSVEIPGLSVRDIRSVLVASNMPEPTFSFDCRTQYPSSAAILGSQDERLKGSQ
jgi:hypothetical protein